MLALLGASFSFEADGDTCSGVVDEDDVVAVVLVAVIGVERASECPKQSARTNEKVRRRVMSAADSHLL